MTNDLYHVSGATEYTFYIRGLFKLNEWYIQAGEGVSQVQGQKDGCLKTTSSSHDERAQRL